MQCGKVNSKEYVVQSISIQVAVNMITVSFKPMHSSTHFSLCSIFDVKPEVSKFIPVDISSFLVEDKKPVSVVDVNTQTNEFHERPPTPEYIPKKTGVDASTQIEPGLVGHYFYLIDFCFVVLICRSHASGLSVDSYNL